MDYPYKTVTDDGIYLMAKTIGQKDNNLIIDRVILSDRTIDDTNELHKLTINDFHDPFVAAIDRVPRKDNTLQPEATIRSTSFSQEYPIYMIGLLAHTKQTNDDVVYSAAVTKNDPFVMPKRSGDELDFTISIPVSFANANDVNVITIDDDYNKLLQYEHQTGQKFAEIDKKFRELHGITFNDVKPLDDKPKLLNLLGLTFNDIKPDKK